MHYELLTLVPHYGMVFAAMQIVLYTLIQYDRNVDDDDDDDHDVSESNVYLTIIML